MRILSFDVGIKNLAYCLLESKNNSFIIEKWDIINLCNEKKSECCICKKKAKYEKNHICYCKLHAKKTNYKIPTPNENIIKIKKQKINELFSTAQQYDISFNKPILKDKLINLINNHIKNNYFDPIVEETADSYNLIELGINMKNKFNAEYTKELPSIDYIIIENQISPIANRMKTIQGMIAQYFIMQNIHNIEFISSVNKLKLFIGNKNTTYNERKKLSVEITTQQLIKNKNTNSWLEMFNKNKKKDDLADCFLQGLYYLSEKKLIDIEKIKEK